MEDVICIARTLWIWLASAMLIGVWTPLLAVVWLSDGTPQRRRTARWFRRLGIALARVNPWRIQITGAERLDPRQAYVIVSNHQSIVDIPLLSHLRLDTKWMAKAELFKTPLLGWMLRMAGDVPVDRSDRRKGAIALQRCARYLREGLSVVCFPEGTRSLDGEMLPFLDGPFQLAIRQGVPILQLVIEGSGSALPRGTWIFGGGSEIRLKILDAIPVAGWNARQVGELRDLVRGKIADELGRMREARAPVAK
jgi:1-acyl-sn-glycerol-3-phosphate acyltransferase